MNYDEIRKLDSTISENNYLITEEKEVKQKKEKRKRSIGKRFLKARLDVYDMLMIPVGIGLLVAFIALMFNVL